MTVTLRPHQIAAADAVESAFRNGVARPLIDACVGSGKSLIFAELARREIERGGRAIILAHTRELVEQNAAACRMLGLTTGVNAAALQERTWRAPVISAAIQSVYKSAGSFGPVTLLLPDECHLWPHSESGMYREFARAFPYARLAGASGTVFRLQGGSLVEGEGAPFDKVVYRYTIVDGIRDGYLVPAFSVGATDKIDPTKLRVRQGEYTNDSQDAQMIGQMDNHICQMVAAGESLPERRRAWLVFEASVKAARAMCERMNQWGIPTGLVLGEMPAGERAQTIERFRRGELRALVNRDTLCLDSKTEILTSEGFVGIDDMTMQHRIAAWKEDGGVEFTKPKLIVRRPRMPHERMITANGGLTPRIRVTSNHRMVVHCGLDGNNTKVVPAEELLRPRWWHIPAFGRCEPERIAVLTPPPKNTRDAQIRANSYNYRKNGVPADEAKRLAEQHADRIRGMRYKHPHELTLDECEVIGFWLGDGTKSGGRVSIQQSFRYPDNIARVTHLLRTTGIQFSWRRYPADRPNGNASVRWSIPRGTGGRGQEVSRGYFEIEPYLEKDGTPLFWGLNRNQLLALLNGFWSADGLHHAKIKRQVIVGTQLPLYNLLQAICSVRGISATIRKASAPRKANHSQQYVFAWGYREKWCVHGSTVSQDAPGTKQERVWCVTSSTSYLICRRGGKVFVTGNTTGFDVQQVDMLVMRRATKSLGLYIQMTGRLLRTVGGNIAASMAAGKADGIVLDFAGNIDMHGPLDFIRPRETKARLVSCDECDTRNAAAAARCWKCDAVMTKNCPACLVPVAKGTLDCPHCAFDMRAERSEPTAAKLFDVPSGAALIASWKSGTDRSGGWQAIRKVWEHEGAVVADGVALAAGLAERVREARWIRADGSAILLPNGASRTSARQVTADGAEIIVPLPAAAAANIG